MADAQQPRPLAEIADEATQIAASGGVTMYWGNVKLRMRMLILEWRAAHGEGATEPLDPAAWERFRAALMTSFADRRDPAPHRAYAATVAERIIAELERLDPSAAGAKGAYDVLRRRWQEISRKRIHGELHRRYKAAKDAFTRKRE